MGKDKVLIFDIKLKEIEPAIWRQVAIKEDSTLEELSGVILLAFGWEAKHLYGYDIGGKEYGLPDETDEKEIIDQAKVHLDELASDALRNFVFTYDYGDNWEHEIELKDVKDADDKIQYPICIAGERNAPPENCGGTTGYEDVIAALKAKKPSKAQKERLMGLGKYDPEAINIKKINKELTDLRRYILGIRKPEDPRVN